MDMHAVKSAASYVAILTFLLAVNGTTAQLCYNTTAGCQSSFFRFTGTGSASPALQCCVSFIGYAYTSSTSNDGCSFCTVYGFVSGMMSTGVQLNSITIKQGDPGVPVSYTLLRGRLSSIRSFTITSSNPRLYTPTTTDSHIQFFAPFAIRYTLKVELSNVALETPKTFILSSTLSSSSGNEFTAPLTVTVLPVNILNIQFTDTVYTVVEGTNKSARLLLRRTQFIEQPLQLRVTPLTLAEAEDRNITLPADAWKDASIYPASYAGDRKQFVNTPQIVSFTTTGSNETIPIQIAILDDGLNGPDVQFVCIVELVNQSFASIVNISSPVALVRIIESDLAVVGFLTDNTMVTEGQAFNICVAVTNPPPQLFLGQNSSFFLQLSIVPLTAGFRDIGKDNASLAVVGPFNNTLRTHCLQLAAVTDMVLQGTRSLNLTASLYGAAPPLLDISPNTTSVTIIDSSQFVIGFTQSQYTATRKGSVVTLSVSIFGGASIQGASVEVMFSTEDGTALAGIDYDARTQLLVFNNTVTQLPISVTIKDDGVFNKYTDVYFGASLTLQSAGGFEQLISLNPHQTNITIKDDHVLVIGFDPVVYSGNGGSVAITVKVLQGSLAVPVSIRVFTQDGTAIFGSDYVATSQSVVFDSSSTNRTVTIQLVNKLVSDASKMFSVGLSVETPEAKGRVTLSPSVANVTIVNTNVAVIGFVAGVYSVRRSEGSVSVMVGVLQGQLGAPVTVTISTYSGTASAGLDFIQTTLPLVFNNTVTQLPISVTIKDDGVFKYTDVYFGASLTLQSAGGFEQLISLNPLQTNVTIKANHVLVIGFDPVVYRGNGGSVAITVKVLQGSLAVPVSIRVFTQDGTAISGSDYVATSQSVVFDSSSTNCIVTIQLVNKLVSGASKMFSVGLSVETPEAKGHVTLSPSVANVTVQGLVNDSVIADPLFTVPLNVHSTLFQELSLCYEIHGTAGRYYNLVSDSCTSVNAHYQYASPNHVSVNIIDAITVRAVDRAGQCVDIEVNVDCGVSVGGSRVQIYSLNEVYVRTYGNLSVRISVPNCNHQQLVMWILCQVRPVEDPNTTEIFNAKMQKFVVTRGLSLGENSHGIIAQFWGAEVSVTKYTGSYSVQPYTDSAYYVLTMQNGGVSKSVLSSVYRFTWERLGGSCLYAGDREGGWMVGGDLSNDLIDGQEKDYIVSSAFGTDFKYSRFTQSCTDRTH